MIPGDGPIKRLLVGKGICGNWTCFCCAGSSVTAVSKRKLKLILRKQMPGHSLTKGYQMG